MMWASRFGALIAIVALVGLVTVDAPTGSAGALQGPDGDVLGVADSGAFETRSMEKPEGCASAIEAFGVPSTRSLATDWFGQATLVEADPPGLAMQAAAPPWEACSNQIRPGARMTSPVGCSFNFVFSQGSTLYIGTAGHCVSTGQRVSGASVGSFGTVVFSVNAGPADDFALIQIDSDKHHLVDPTLCTWGGPTGVGSTSGLLDQDFLLEYGWGVATTFTSQTRSRIHDEFLSSNNVLSWNGVGSGGDSGAALVYGDGRAAGIHTHGLTPVVGATLESGPTIERILDLTSGAGFNLQLETANTRWTVPV